MNNIELLMRQMEAKINTMRELLEHCQWVQPMYNGSPSCSYCGIQQHAHTPCELSELLGE